MWDIWKEYINSVFQLITSNEKNRARKSSDSENKEKSIENSPEESQNAQNESETVDDTPEKAHEFICRVLEDSSRNGKYISLYRMYDKF